MMTFKQYLENMWGEIPWPYKKPSDGPGGLDANPSKASTNTSGGSSMGAPVTGAPMMMKKKMGKKMKKI